MIFPIFHYLPTTAFNKSLSHVLLRRVTITSYHRNHRPNPARSFCVKMNYPDLLVSNGTEHLISLSSTPVLPPHQKYQDVTGLSGLQSQKSFIDAYLYFCTLNMAVLCLKSDDLLFLHIILFPDRVQPCMASKTYASVKLSAKTSCVNVLVDGLPLLVFVHAR